MTVNRQPTADELNGVRQDTVHWPGKAHRVTQVDSDGNIIDSSNPLPVVSTIGSHNDLEGLGKTAVGVTAVEVSFIGITESITITADTENTGLLYIGKASVLTDGSNAITFLEAGDDITLDYEDSINAIFVVASVAGQNFWAGASL